jgi:hypothetical protein
MKKILVKFGIIFGCCFGLTMFLILGLAAGPMGPSVLSVWMMKPLFFVSLLLTVMTYVILHKKNKKKGEK